MNKIVCDLCEGTEFTKEGGFFICQGCGTKYSLEEAKSMMREVEGGASPAVAPAASVPMGNPNQQQIDNLLILATNAKEAGNNQEAESYCNQVIALDATAYKAWLLKGKAIGWSTKLDDNRMEEAAHSFCQAIDFAPEEEKEEVKNQAVEELKSLGLACIFLRKQNFGNSPSGSNLAGFKNDRAILLKALTVLLSHGHVVGMPEDYFDQIATMMNEGAVAAYNMATDAWRNVDHPSDKDLTTYLDWMDNIEQLLRESIDASDDDDEADIQRYKNLAIVLEDPIGKSSQKREWMSWKSAYDWVSSKSLTDAAVKTRRSQAQECRNKIAEIERKTQEKKAAEAKKAEEEKQARIKAYWDAHADEKASLEAEKKELETKTASLTKEISDLDGQIKAATPTGNVPSEDEDSKIRDQIKDLENRRAKLGMFSGKEKKQIGEEIASLKSKVEEEKKTRQAEADAKVVPLKAKRDELSADLDKAKKRISAIEAEFAKDPEE